MNNTEKPRHPLIGELEALLDTLEAERRRGLQVIQEKERLYRLLVENSLGLMCAHDLDGILLSINPAAAQSLGYQPEDGVGHNLREYLSPSTQHLFDGYMERIHHNPSDSGLMRLVARDGTERIWLYRNVRYEEPGKPPCVLGHALDITERVRAEQALEQAHAELALRVAEHTAALADLNARVQAAEAAVSWRDAFLATTAHDLRTPLTIIMGYIDLMSMELQHGHAITPEWLRQRLDPVAHAGSQMLAAVEEIMDAALLQMGEQLPLRMSAVDLGEIVRAVSATINVGSVGAAGTAAPVIQDAIGAAVVEGDRMRLERVILNIVTNAVKYSPQGTPVHVDVREQEQQVVVTVRDAGVGIPSDELPHIFTLFYRASTSTGIPGRGIGLAGARAIVEQHGGRITVDSTVGHGTTVVVSLPLRPSAPGAA